jgi:hypothetical protein
MCSVINAIFKGTRRVGFKMIADGGLDSRPHNNEHRETTNSPACIGIRSILNSLLSSVLPRPMADHADHLALPANHYNGFRNQLILTHVFESVLSSIRCCLPQTQQRI